MAADRLPVGSIDPTAGPSLMQLYAPGGQRPSAERVSVASDGVAASEGDARIARSLAIGGQGSPAMGLLVFAGMAVGTAYLVNVLGRGDDYSDLRAAAMSVLVASFAAVAGIPVWKALFAVVPVPGISTWVQAV